MEHLQCHLQNWFFTQEKWQKEFFHLLDGLFATAPASQISSDLAKRLYTKRNALYGSITRLEEFNSCPFKHFADYALRLTERREYTFAAPERGQLLHETMRAFSTTLLEKGLTWRDIKSEQREAICTEIVAKLARQIGNDILSSSRQYQHLLRRLQKTANEAIARLCDFAKHSQFETVSVEQVFGKGKKALPPLVYKLSGKMRLEITGQIDRIDKENENGYILVIDYKTGQTTINLLEVYYGLKLQLLTYMLAVQNALPKEQSLPAGVLYCYLRTTLMSFDGRMTEAELAKELNKKMQMSGWLLADSDVIQKIDDSISYIKVHFNKDGSVSKRDIAYVKTKEEFALLLDYIGESLRQAGQDIVTGTITIKPYRLQEKTPCEYCPYLSICHFDTTIPGYCYRELKQQDNDSIMKEIASGRAKADA